MRPPARVFGLVPGVMGRRDLGVRLRIQLFLLYASACCAAPSTPVFLCQVYVVVDRESFDAIRNAPDVRALAGFWEDSDASDGGWGSFYLMGRQTAIEVLAAGRAPDGEQATLGQSGIGLGYSDPSGTPYFEKRLRSAFGDKVRVVPAIEEGPGQAPIPAEIDVDRGATDILSTWFMETSPGYLVARLPSSQSERPSGHRHLLAARFLPNSLLDDVVGLTVALSSSEASLLIGELSVAGWTSRRTSGMTMITGPDVRITVVAAGSRAGIREAELRLRRTVERKITPLGDAQLQLDGEAGRLSFWGPD